MKHPKLYTAQPRPCFPKHGRLRTYWQAKAGSWTCGHIHHSAEVAAECAAKLNGAGAVAARARKAGG